MNQSALSPQARERAWRAMGDHEVDVLVVGGGIVGAGAALDAVSRGLSVALVEARDWASGTSSRSSKLIHGGLRCLEMLDFRLVGEALRERGLLLQRIAPHLVRPVPFVLPFTGVWERLYVGSGLLLYDGLGHSRSMPRGVPGHQHLSKRGALAECPSLKPSVISGAVRYYDAQVDDARYTLTVVRTAAALGAWCANRVSMRSYTRDGDRVTGAVVVDTETGAEQVVHARQVINATGVWTGGAQAAAGTDHRVRVRASKGVHLLVPRDRLDLASGLILRTEKSVLFVIPWDEHWLIGTTDTEWTLDKAHPAVNATDVKYLLDRVNRLLAAPLSTSDVVGVYAGLRPLVDCRAQDDGQTAKMSREHVVTRLAPGLVAVAGGKYTTYRVMAADAVDEAVRELPHPVPESATAELPLLGAEGCHAVCNSVERLAAQYGLPVERLQRMIGRYGTLIEQVLEPASADPLLTEPLPGACEYLRAEIRYAATHEDARHLDDVLTRHTHASIITADRGEYAAEEAARIIAPLLGWDATETSQEIGRYRQRVAAERRAQQQPDDHATQAIRNQAPEFVPARTWAS